MGDLEIDTKVTGSEGQYLGSLSKEWEIWGPQGGYVGALALRAAGAESIHTQPASFYAHYLNVAEFDDVSIEVKSLRQSRRAESLRVSLSQNETPIMEALVWTTDALSGLDHDGVEFPNVPSPDEVKSWSELFPENAPPFPFWYNVEGKPIGYRSSLEGKPQKPFTQNWMRFLPISTFEDAFLDASRLLILLDVAMFPAATRAHGGGLPYVAPSMDIAVTFHQFDRETEWVLIEAESQVAARGLVGGRATAWSRHGKLLASAIQQMIQRSTGQ